MSKGIGAHANLVFQDNQTVIYEYGGYNLNDERFKNENYIYDGMITVQRSCFLESDIHQKLKRMPSGRKRLITKRVVVDVDYPKYINDGLIAIENCSNCWMITEDKHIDVMALYILFKLFLVYQEQGEIPEYINYNM